MSASKPPRRRSRPVFDRRLFLRAGSGAALGLYLSPLACETNEVRPKLTGSTFAFLTPIDARTDRRDRGESAHFIQFGAEGSVPGWRYEDIPVLGRGDWRLELGAGFARPTTLTFDDLTADDDDVRTIIGTLRCIFDSTAVPGLVGTALWRGVPLRRFLDAAGVPAAARRLRLFGRDGFTNNLRRADIFLDDGPMAPLLAYAVNGEPVPHIHGGPVRLIVPGKFGYKNLKWVDRIEATEDDAAFGSYQSAFGFFDDGTIGVTTKVTDPLARARIPAGAFEIFGYALSGAAPIRSVEVSIDDAPFAPAPLEPLSELTRQFPDLGESLQVQAGLSYPFAGVWSLFRFPWNATPGLHRLRVRATDETGATQPPRDEDARDGSNGQWDIEVEVG